jgi:hypothetical protein
MNKALCDYSYLFIFDCFQFYVSASTSYNNFIVGD